jgi:hypothetical protein
MQNGIRKDDTGAVNKIRKNISQVQCHVMKNKGAILQREGGLLKDQDYWYI